MMRIVAIAVFLVLAQQPPFDSRVSGGAEITLAQDRPPKDPAATRAPDLVELVKLDPTIKLDIRYAGTNNFLGKPVYKEARAFLQRPAAESLLKAHRELQKSGYGLLIHDGYRPWAITKLFWDMTSGVQREFVADPAKFSIAWTSELRTAPERRGSAAVGQPAGSSNTTSTIGEMSTNTSSGSWFR